MVNERIRAAREHIGYSQTYLAKRLDTAQSTVSDYEHDRQLPTVQRCIDIADICGVSRVWLVTGEGDMLQRYSSAAIDTSQDGLINRIVIARVAGDFSYAAINRRSGISLEAMRRWEQRLNEPGLAQLLRYAEAVDVSPAWLILGIGKAPLKEVVS